MSAATKFTPGPWHRAPQRPSKICFGGVFKTIADVSIAHKTSEEYAANLHLIAAAPDLFSALSTFMEGCEAHTHRGPCPNDGGDSSAGDSDEPCDFCVTRAALAKARGA